MIAGQHVSETCLHGLDGQCACNVYGTTGLSIQPKEATE